MNIPMWLALVVGIVSTARMARLITHDDFPPMDWLRVHLFTKLHRKWQPVFDCPFCISPYLMAVQITWGWLLWEHGGFFWFWFVPNAWWAASYLAAMVVAYDQPE